MTRVIKFRVWDEKRKTMFNVFNTYLPKGIKRKCDFFIGFNSNGLEVSEYEGKGYWRIFPLMQYTGLKDKNGKEIYDGDIINIKTILYRFDGYQVEYFADDVRYIAKKLKRRNEAEIIDMIPIKADWDIEVIGNIYENPELLTQED